MTAISADPDELRGLAHRYADGGATYRSLSSTARALPLPGMPGHVAYRVQASLGEVSQSLASLSAEIGEQDSRLLKQTAQRFDDSQRLALTGVAGFVVGVGREAIPLGQGFLAAMDRLQWVRGATGTYLRQVPVSRIPGPNLVLDRLNKALDFAEGVDYQLQADRMDPRFSGRSGAELGMRSGVRGAARTFAGARGGFAGAAKGALVGARIGLLFGGHGAVVGAIAGAFIGYYVGEKSGSWAGDRVADAFLYDPQTALRTAVADVRSAVPNTAAFVGSVVGGIGGLLLGGARGPAGSITGAIEGVRIGNANGTAFGRSVADRGLGLIPFGLGR